MEPIKETLKQGESQKSIPHQGFSKPVCPSRAEPWREAECLTCRDTEWICPLDENGKPDYSRVVPCHCKIKREKEENLRYSLEKSGIPDTRRVNTFDTFKQVEGAKDAFRHAKILAGGLADFSLLLIYGKTGNGKTLLAYAACLHAIEAGKRAVFKPVLELFSELRMAMNEPRKSADEIVDYLKKVDFLALDDVGAQPFDEKMGRSKSEYHDAVLEEIINYRYAHKKPLIMTMNRAPSTLPDPIRSRLSDPEVSRSILNEAPDFRRRKG